VICLTISKGSVEMKQTTDAKENMTRMKWVYARC
jgi:hypothetical protein